MDSVTLSHWHDAVNAADILLWIAKGQTLGMCSGLKVNREQCNYVLTCGQELGIIPDALEARLKRLQPA